MWFIQSCTETHELIFSCFGWSCMAPSVPFSTETLTFLSPFSSDRDSFIHRETEFFMFSRILVVSVGTVYLTPHVVAQGLPRLY